VVFSCTSRKKYSSRIEFDYSRNPQNSSYSTETSRTLVTPGHTLQMDNFYSSPELPRQLQIEHSTECISTLKLNRKNIPKEVKDKKLNTG
jgi:hypothetical protein